MEVDDSGMLLRRRTKNLMLLFMLSAKDDKENGVVRMAGSYVEQHVKPITYSC